MRIIHLLSCNKKVYKLKTQRGNFMKKTLILFSLLLIFILLLFNFGCNVDKSKTDVKNLCDKDINELDAHIRVFCISEKAIKASNPSLCEDLADIKETAICYQFVSKKISDIRLCDKVSIVEPTVYCYSDVAIAGNNEKICDLINTESSLKQCYKELINQPNYAGLNLTMECKRTIKSTNQLCYTTVAFHKKDVTICNQITTSDEAKRVCYSNIQDGKGSLTIVQD